MQSILFGKRTPKQTDGKALSPSDRYDIRIKASRAVYSAIDRQVGGAMQDIMRATRKAMKMR